MIIPAVCFVVAGVLLGSFLYPYVGYPLVLRSMKARPTIAAHLRRGTGSEFALLFCAYNEREVIDEKIANLGLLRARYPELELWAYDDKSTDGTAEALEGAGLGINVVRGVGRSGKAHGMKEMVARTQRPLLVFTDANVTLDEEALDQLTSSFADPNVGGVCGTLRYLRSGDTIPGTATEQVGGGYWRLEESIKTEESRTGNVMGADGSIFSVRRTLYPDFVDSVQDDFTASMAVIFSGARLVKSDRVIAYERLVAARSVEWERKIRIAVRAFHTYLAMAAMVKQMTPRDRFCFYSHKWMRWHGGYFLLGATVFSLVGGFALSWELGIVLSLLAALACGLAMVVKRGPIGALFEVVISVAATAIGVLRARLGQTMSVWNPPPR